MGRTPCCQKKGLKKGPWTHEEDHILISYIQRYGHHNWRALPKQAGLLRCGKSCRLRWTNYLRPGIKRGNFSAEEEDTIMKLHEMIGNRWSAIAARLPGRTDNEIKNYWRTHLMKRLSTNAVINNTKHVAELETSAVTEMGKNAAVLEDGIDGKHEEMSNNWPNFELLNEDFWADVLSENEFQLQCNATTCGCSWWLEDDDKLDYSWGS